MPALPGDSLPRRRGGSLSCFCFAWLWFSSFAGLLAAPQFAVAADLAPRRLPPPQTRGGLPLIEALEQRKTTRDFKPDKLSTNLLSNLLWAAFGVNRPASGHRTAPSAMNAQEVDVHLFCASAGLGTVVHDLDRESLAGAMKLRPDQHIILAQAVGFPKGP